MRVGLSLFHLVPGETGGVEVYDRRLIDALVRARPDLRLTLFSFAAAADSLRAEPWSGDVAFATVRGSGRRRALRVAVEQALAPLARRHRLDLLHNLLTTAPAVPGVPQVTTIHDVIYKRYPETHFGVLSLGVAALVPLAVRRSRRLIADSEATADDLVRYFRAPRERVDVVHPGPGLAEPARPLPESELRARLGIGEEPIVLTVSAKRPHKNLRRLVEAFARVEEPGVLLVPGYPTEHEEELRRAAGEAVRFTGWLDDEVLDAAYRAARCLLFPSLAEGFGLPILEAMTRGTAVACSNTSSLPEVAGDAALLFDPLDTDAIADAIRRLLTDDMLRERLRAAGLERVRSFSWESAAEQTVRSYERALGAR